MNSRRINTLKKMRENIIRQHHDGRGRPKKMYVGRKESKDWSRLVNIDNELKSLRA